MTAPRLTRPLVLEDLSEVSDGAGGLTRTWVALGTLWAAVTLRTGRQVAQGAASLSRAQYRITVRGAPVGAPSRPRPDQRFRDGDRVFHIQAVAEADETARYLICFAQEEVAA